MNAQDFQCKKKCTKEYECGHLCVQKIFKPTETSKTPWVFTKNVKKRKIEPIGGRKI